MLKVGTNFHISAWIVTLSRISFCSFPFTVQQFEKQTKHLYVKLISTISARGGNQRSMDMGFTVKGCYELQKKGEKKKRKEIYLQWSMIVEEGDD
jgi:hypothetical protein